MNSTRLTSPLRTASTCADTTRSPACSSAIRSISTMSSLLLRIPTTGTRLLMTRGTARGAPDQMPDLSGNGWGCCRDSEAVLPRWHCRDVAGKHVCEQQRQETHDDHEEHAVLDREPEQA